MTGKLLVTLVAAGLITLGLGWPRAGFRRRIARWGPAFAAPLGIVLLLLGILAFASASNDNGSADSARARTRELSVQKEQADSRRSDIVQSAGGLATEVGSLVDLSNTLTAAHNTLTAAFNSAVGLANSGDTNGAQAAFAAQAAALGDLDSKLTTVQQAVVRAQQRVADLQTKAQTGGS